ncbi:cytochrome P450 [Novosphingobium sp. PhB165]|uniref:cytochrome P450 n=1 Tax=Novosphingobium sp. PhB165 TaxID=2485105 RepID=UPI00104D9B1D|nr:cytochrome P450 [Novosphingobium sp. PhB165]TCM12729.1 cytochrome P450 [Novosphingobium sp. PhB165]
MTYEELPFLPVEEPNFWADPEQFMVPTRAKHPWLARFSAGYVVHGCQANKDLFADERHLEMGLGGIVEFYELQDTMWARFMNEMLLSKRGEEHKRLRASVASAFTPRNASVIRPLVQGAMTALLDEWLPKGRFDFTEFASYFPVSVMCGLLGISTEVIPSLRWALEMQVAAISLDLSLRGKILEAFDIKWNVADDLIRLREAQGAVGEPSLLDDLIAARDAGGMDDTELRFMLLVLLVAGYDTSKNLLGMMMNLLIDRPDIYERCREDKAFCALVVEETLRHSTIATPFRQVTESFDYNGMRFEKGRLVAMATPLAGRDPAAFPEPLRFDPEREHKVRHVGFGRGAHICLGQYLARNQLEEGIHLIAKRMYNPRRDGDVSWRPMLGAWGPRTLPIAFDPE